MATCMIHTSEEVFQDLDIPMPTGFFLPLRNNREENMESVKFHSTDAMSSRKIITMGHISPKDTKTTPRVYP